MSAPPAYKIDVENGETVVRLRSGLLDQHQLARFLDYLELESIRQRSRLTEEDAETFADEIDQAVWDRNRSRIQD